MTKLVEYLKRHQLIAYFVLTYVFTWTLLLLFQPLYFEGQRAVAPLIIVGIFAPALVSIGLSAVFNPRPRQGSRKPAVIAFFVVWILASLIITTEWIVVVEMDWSIRLLVESAIIGSLPALVASSAFSRIPGVSAQMRTYIKPRGAFGYYLLALVLFPAIWLVGNVLSRILGMEAPLSSQPVDVKLLGIIVISFFYNCCYSGLAEEPGWRGFALPRLQGKFSPLVSSLILGVLWAVWHAPGRFGGIEAKSLSDTLVEWVLILLVTIIFTWLFNRTKGSILVTALLHPAMNATTKYLTGSLGALILLFVFIVFIITLDKMWRRLPTDNPAIYQTSTLAA